MAVRTSFFGVTQLTGPDSAKFANQVAYGKPKREAVQSLAKGKLLLNEMAKSGGSIKLKLSSGKMVTTRKVEVKSVKRKAK